MRDITLVLNHLLTTQSQSAIDGMFMTTLINQLKAAKGQANNPKVMQWMIEAVGWGNIHKKDPQQMSWSELKLNVDTEEQRFKGESDDATQRHLKITPQAPPG
eukprot:1751047-Rhodomonas_salina.1